MTTRTPATDPRTPAAAEAVETAPAVRAGSPAYRLSVALGVVTLGGAVPTVLVPSVLHGPAAMNGSARGTALVMAAVAVPGLAVGAAGSARGRGAAVPLWLGSVAYLLYNAVMLLFGTPFNALFPCYVATLSLSAWTAGMLLRDADLTRFAGPAARRDRAVATYAWVVTGLNTLAWLRGVVPGLAAGDHPDFLVGTGLTTLPTYVQDLSLWLPLMGVAAWWLWQGRALGRLLVGGLLAMWVVESVGIAVDQYAGHAADPASPVVSAGAVPAFAVLAVIGALPVVALLRRVR